MSEARSGAPWLWLSAVTLAADRATKYLIEARTTEEFRFVVVPQVLTIVHSQNPGIAFGVFSDSPSRWLELALIGGAAGNVLDRVLHGVVTDFVEVRLGHYLWPAFNVADSALTVGAALILIELLFSGRQTRAERA